MTEKQPETPIVIEREKSESSDRRTRLADIQEAEGHLLTALRRVTRAVDSGIDTYLTARDESIKEKGDQAFADLLPNAARGLSNALEILSPLPTDIVNAFYPDRVRDLVEDGTKVVGRVLDFDFRDDDDKK